MNNATPDDQPNPHVGHNQTQEIPQKHLLLDAQVVLSGDETGNEGDTKRAGQSNGENGKIAEQSTNEVESLIGIFQRLIDENSQPWNSNTIDDGTNLRESLAVYSP